MLQKFTFVIFTVFFFLGGVKSLHTNPFLMLNNLAKVNYSNNPFLASVNNIFGNSPFFSQSVTEVTTTRKTVFSDNPFLSQDVTTVKPEVTFSDLTPENVKNRQDFDVSTQEETVKTEIVSSIQCGRPIVTNQLIVNGEDIPRGAHPWLGALFRVTDLSVLYICGSTLISNKHLITAAHCVHEKNRKLKPRNLLIVLGKMNILHWTSTPTELILEPDKIHVHPDYEAQNSDADIALIQLDDPVEFSKQILPICLWSGPDDLALIVNMKGVVVGWGKNEEGSINSETPKQTMVPIVDQETCLRSADQFSSITSNRTFCGGFRNGSGPCNGDSGGALMIQKDGIWMLRGIISISLSNSQLAGSCDLSNYVVFTDAAKFNDWIISMMT